MQAAAERDMTYEPQLEEPALALDEGEGEGYWADLAAQTRLFWRGVRFSCTWHALCMVVATCLATLACSKGVLDTAFDTSMSIVAIGTVLPLVFSVQAAFARREKALVSLAQIKATLFSLYLMFLTWDRSEDRRWATEAEACIHKLLDDMEWYLRCDPRRRKLDEPGDTCYDGFAAFAAKMSEFGPHCGFTQGGQGGVSTMSAYLRTLMHEFESVRAVRDSETPVGLRLFCFTLIHTTPIILAPYWNHFCAAESRSEFRLHFGCVAGYFVAVTYVIIVMALYKVQVELEDPFDGDGDDDIKWELWRSQLDQLGNYGQDGPNKRLALSRYLETRRARKEMLQGIR